ncbi:hypothetical protein ACWELJ_19410 [Nocardia sp. NPDC004582]
MTTELTVFSDYRQIHLLDSGSSTQLADRWSDSTLLGYLALADDGIGIRTGVDGDVTVSIDVTGVAPADDNDAFDTVTECSLRADSGVLRIACPTFGTGDGDPVWVPKGWLRVRVSLTKSPDDDEYGEDSDDPADWQHVRIQCWPAEPADAVLIKGWNPQTSQLLDQG